MSKKKLDVMAEERKNFIYGIVDENDNVLVPGCIRNGVDEESANKIYDEMAEFAKYAFNKSHAACYAVVAYRTAYLKCYYPTEFFSSMMNSVIGSQSKVPYYIDECKKRKINVLKPDINKSFARFTVDGNDIIFGLAAIKNVGEGAINAITNEREKNGKFQSFTDFCERIAGEQVNKKCIESLILSGAFDEVDSHNRSTLLSSFENILDQINSDRRRGLSGQMNIFDIGKTDDNTKNSSAYSYIEVEERPKIELLEKEKEMLGFYVSGHPLDDYRDLITNISSVSSIDFASLYMDETDDENTTIMNNIEPDNQKLSDGKYVRVVGLISNVRTKVTRNNDIMAFVDLEDLDGTISLIVFSKTYVQYKNLIYDEAIVFVEGRLNIKEGDEPSIIATKIRLVDGTDDLNEIKKEVEEREKAFAKKVTSNYSNLNSSNFVSETGMKIENLSKDSILEKAYNLAMSKKKLIINIPKGLTEEQLADLRQFVRNMKNKTPNTKCTIVNGDISKDMDVFADQETIQGLYKRIGEENVRIM